MTGAATRRAARGVKRTEGSGLRVVITFDPETFEQVRNRADRLETSFAEQIRTLVEWGLEADGEDDGR